ncbi:metal ABC transporter ATP-binding protein [Actinomycetaceae bacterium TAE3-ERU4]|nr:metal ABC transporter ATP-binding protein [Actinomycetaceae bacterium TAE3-ERU4]
MTDLYNSAPTPLLDARNIGVTYGSGRVVSNVTLTLYPGEVKAVLGPNGSGKSSLIKALVGVNQIIDGTLSIFGQSARKHYRSQAKKIGYVPQRLSQAAGISATSLEVVESGLTGPWLFHTRHAKSRAQRALSAVQMEKFANRPVSSLSGGQHQRVLIARALVREPKLLIMDEPLAGIDAESAKTLAKILKTQKETGVGILLVLHDLGCLEEIIDSLLVLEQGKTVAQGPIDEFRTGKHELLAHSHPLCGESQLPLGGFHL